MDAIVYSIDGNVTNYYDEYDKSIYRWIALDANWKTLWFARSEALHGTRKHPFIRMEQSSDEIIDVEKCKRFCDQTTICQYFFITEDGKCLLYQSCKVISNRNTGLLQGNTNGHIFEKGITLILLFVNVQKLKNTR